jgi:hypothetical protein
LSRSILHEPLESWGSFSGPFDTLIAIWFMAGAPAFPRKQFGERPSP